MLETRSTIDVSRRMTKDCKPLSSAPCLNWSRRTCCYCRNQHLSHATGEASAQKLSYNQRVLCSFRACLFRACRTLFLCSLAQVRSSLLRLVTEQNFYIHRSVSTLSTASACARFSTCGSRNGYNFLGCSYCSSTAVKYT